LRAAAEEYLTQIAAPSEKALVEQGFPAAVIADAATRLDAGLVVVASSGKGLAARIALGSTTDRLMHSLHRPLLIVPE
jgi:nucleotide-binding universal stress UspA family protein